MDLGYELKNVYEVKVAICYLLEKIEYRLRENELNEIVFNNEFINYFLYASAIEELIINDSIARVYDNEIPYIELRDKGREAAKTLKKDVQFRFRKHLLESAFRFNSEKSVDSDVTVFATKRESGYSVEAVFGDKNLELMRLSLYAPDEDQAEYLKFQIREDPNEFYKTVIESLIFAKRPTIEITEEMV
ncbi:MAG: DUF4364 family protein [Ruminococcus sp.]|jgi:hypothetical protein|nr:DUF4364 family protein [Ruminococcus sp.]